MDCPVQYQDPRRYLCPCYSKLAQCLVEIGCSMKQKVDIVSFCTRKGYCKDGYCAFRAGDLTPRIDTRPEVFELTSVPTPGSPCVDNCCQGQTGCSSQDAALLNVRAAGRAYRKEEVLLPPRQCVLLQITLDDDVVAAASCARQASAVSECGAVVLQRRPTRGREPELRPHALQHSTCEPPVALRRTRGRTNGARYLHTLDANERDASARSPRQSTVDLIGAWP